MKRTERHKLKENEFARTVTHAKDVFEARSRDITTAVVIAVVVIAVVGGYTWYRQSRNTKANGLLASALAVYEAPVVPVTAPAPGSPMPVPQAGTYQTERAKLEAVLPKFLETADRYPGTNAGIAARYHAAGVLATLGRYGEAEQRFQEVVDKGGSGVYGRTAHLGLADAQVAQGKYDQAIKVYQELATDSKSQLPLDGILMQLGRAYAKAGKKDDAAHAFTRIVEEFPQSLYAADAHRAMEEVKKG